MCVASMNFRVCVSTEEIILECYFVPGVALCNLTQLYQNSDTFEYLL